VQFAARQRGLEHVARIDGALGLAGPDHRVDLVDEYDDPALLGGDLLQDRLQPLLELAAVLGSGQQRGQIERQDLLSLQRLGHLLVDDPLGQALDDGRLAHAGLADQHRVVLGASLKDLDRAADFIVAADDRVELALLRPLGEIDRVLLQRLAPPLGLGRIDAGAAPHGLDGRVDRPAGQAVLPRQAAGLALVVGQREQKHLAGDIGISAPLRLLVGLVQQADQVAPDLDLAVVALHLRQTLQRRIDRPGQRPDGNPGALQQRAARCTGCRCRRRSTARRRALPGIWWSGGPVAWRAGLSRIRPRP
jgi:hypothetical protein